MTSSQLVRCLVLAGALGACDVAPPSVEGPDTRFRLEQDLRTRPPAEGDARCWHEWVQPAVFESVTEQVLVQPPSFDAEGRMIAPAVFRSVTQQREVRPRRQVWYRIPCPAELIEGPAVFTASLQRALKARGFYGGEVNGLADAATREAVLRFQRRFGLESDVLSYSAAQALGLIALVRG
jgi:hypothetical protein